MREVFDKQGWIWASGVVPRAVVLREDEALREEIGGCSAPLLRVLTSRREPHERNAAGFITNAVIHPGRLDADAFPKVHGIEGRMLDESKLLSVIASLLDGPPALLQSGWWQSTRGTPMHRDVHPVDPTSPMVGVWIALEDITLESGPLAVLDGSHQLDRTDPSFAAYLDASETAYRHQYLDRRLPTADESTRVQALLAAAIADKDLSTRAFPVPAGDAIFWSSQTVHGSLPPTPGAPSRSSMLMHFVLAESVGL